MCVSVLSLLWVNKSGKTMSTKRSAPMSDSEAKSPKSLMASALIKSSVMKAPTAERNPVIIGEENSAI